VPQLLWVFKGAAFDVASAGGGENFANVTWPKSQRKGMAECRTLWSLGFKRENLCATRPWKKDSEIGPATQLVEL